VTDRIAGIELSTLLGSGGMGRVYLGRDPGFEGFDSFKAVKLVAPTSAEQVPEFRRRFKKEILYAELVNHPNLVQVQRTGEENGQCFAVMPYIEGLDLRKLLAHLHEKGSWLELPMIAFVIHEVLAALSAVHNAKDPVTAAPLGLIHRDVAAPNVMLSSHGNVLLLDFGIARLASDDTTHISSGQPGSGRIHSMAPEQFKLDPASRAAAKRPPVDLYAVGVMLHLLLDRRRLRDHEDPDVVYGMAREPGVPALEREDDVPPALDKLRRRLLDPNPQTRIQTAKEARLQLRRWGGFEHEYEEQLSELICKAKDIKAPGGTNPLLRAVPDPAAESQPDGDSTHLNLPEPAAMARPTAPKPNNRPVVLAGVGAICVAGIGIAMFASSQMGPANPSQPREDQAQVAAAPAAKDKAPEPEPDAKPTDEPTSGERINERIKHPAKDSPFAMEPPPKVEDPAPAEGHPAPTQPPAAEKPKPKKEKAKGKATVEFKTGEFQFVWIKVKGKVLPLEPIRTTELPSGKHRVYFRVDEADPWKSAGWIKLDPGKSYVARMHKPGEVRLSTK
jgi:serine/threonine protein kinase